MTDVETPFNGIQERMKLVSDMEPLALDHIIHCSISLFLRDAKNSRTGGSIWQHENIARKPTTKPALRDLFYVRAQNTYLR